ncbi:MAG: 4-hydroxy-tetrahydrodipicolinate synthase [Candidatus Sumerlaeia bacterium]|nr:4-hydroxy-tetrahydrodipicolinate synthase [Candidatus Sumerlaeia bacterium]
MFEGTIVAIVTPFKAGKIDETAYAELIEWQLSEGVNGFVPCGTTGESATLTYEEHNYLVRLTVEIVNGRVPVIAGTGSNSTEETLFLTKNAKEHGADGVLLISPYYNRPTQEGLYQHYRCVAEAVDIPQILYNIPGRTAVNINIETVCRLAELPNIVGIKEASGNLDYVSQIVARTDLTVLSGNDSLTLPLMALGGKGAISVTANATPRLFVDMVNSALAGNWNLARELHYRLFPLFEALFTETNPAGIKSALAMMGKIQNEIRLPLVPMSEANQQRLRQVMNQLALL